MSPEDDETGVAVETDLTITFDEDVQKGAGNIVITETGGSAFDTIPVTDARVSVVGAVVTIYKDRSFSFELKTPPASALLKKMAQIAKGSGTAKTESVGQVTRAQVREIAQIKMPDLNAADLEAAERMIEGSARSMGIEVVEE